MELTKRRLVAVLSVAVSVMFTTASVASGQAVSSQAAEPRAAGAAALALPSSWGVFQVRCHWSHSAPDDPIVAPRDPGAAHRHEFFGNVSTDAHSTTRRLARRGTTCARSQDRSAYWAPTLLHRGKRIQPNQMIAYYRSGFMRDPSVIRSIPRGLRMIAGDGHATRPQSRRVAQWSCDGDGPRGHREVPQSCPGAPLRLRIMFPNCWNGRTLDSANHKRHMAYSHLNDKTCPASHPIPLPTLQLGFRYDISGPLDGIQLSSGSRFSGHADFWNAWKPAALRGLVQQCVLAGRKCDSPPLPPRRR